MAETRVHPARVALRVSDVGRSADFYRRIGGLEVRDEDAEHATLAAADGGPVLLELRRAERAGPAPRRATGLFHTAFRYPTRAQLGATLRGLLRERAPLTGASHHLVSEALYLDDPDGLGIELYRDLPRDQWPAPAPGARVAMDSIPLDLESVLAEPEPDEDPAAGMDVGHVHLKVATVDDAVRWWTNALGMDVMAQLGPQAAFLSTEGYHHDIGANTWMSAGAEPEPREGPGLDEIVLRVAGDPGLAGARERLAGTGASVEEAQDGSIVTATPDAVPVRLEEGQTALNRVPHSEA
jgi:catechol 2,3-dioxygenase